MDQRSDPTKYPDEQQKHATADLLARVPLLLRLGFLGGRMVLQSIASSIPDPVCRQAALLALTLHSLMVFLFGVVIGATLLGSLTIYLLRSAVESPTLRPIFDRLLTP